VSVQTRTSPVYVRGLLILKLLSKHKHRQTVPMALRGLLNWWSVHIIWLCRCRRCRYRNGWPYLHMTPWFRCLISCSSSGGGGGQCNRIAASSATAESANQARPVGRHRIKDTVDSSAIGLGHMLAGRQAAAWRQSVCWLLAAIPVVKTEVFGFRSAVPLASGTQIDCSNSLEASVRWESLGIHFPVRYAFHWFKLNSLEL